MIHLGDITRLSGYSVPVVDVIIGGSPCQNLSISGNREGLAGIESGLFFEQIRIIYEMREREKRNGKSNQLCRPRFALWENVPGALSSNLGEDFRTVLQQFAGTANPNAYVPRPQGGAWRTSGAIMGDGWSIAWRIFDSQFWGVPQRRRRIALVADFGGFAAPEILFIRKSLCGDSTASEGQGETSAPGVKSGSGTASKNQFVAGFCAGAGSKAAGIGYNNDLAPTLKGAPSGNMAPSILCLNDQGGSIMKCSEDVSGTLRAQEHGHQPIVLATQQGGAEIGCDVCPTITAAAGMSGNNQPVLYENHGLDARYTGPLTVAPTVSASYGTGGNNVPLVQSGHDVYCISGNVIEREVCNGGNGIGYQKNTAYTLTTADHHAVYEPYQRTIGTLCHGDEKGIGNQYVQQDKCIINRACLVRRLTPLECERLQGFPDGWTDIGPWVDEFGKRHKESSDSARYKALGNSIALPPWRWVLRRLCAQFGRKATMASLFDGIGGFPLIWAEINGIESCLWASEIEQFPIAVTKYHFGEERCA